MIVYSLFCVFDQALHQATRLENLVQLFIAESQAIGIKPVHGIDDAIAKYVFDKIVEKMVMYMYLIILTQNNFHAIKATVDNKLFYYYYIAQRLWLSSAVLTTV